jgi:hypothetical protein
LIALRRLIALYWLATLRWWLSWLSRLCPLHRLSWLHWLCTLGRLRSLGGLGRRLRGLTLLATAKNTTDSLADAA